MLTRFEAIVEIGYRDVHVAVEADVTGRTVRLYRVEDDDGSDIRWQLSRDEREYLSTIAYEDHKNDRALPVITDDDIEDEAVDATAEAVR